MKKQDVLTLKTEVLSTVHEEGKSEVDKEIVLPNTPKYVDIASTTAEHANFVTVGNATTA